MKKVYYIAISILFLLTIGIGSFLFFNDKKNPPIESIETQEKEIVDVDTDVDMDLKLVIFHNGAGPMCLDALDFFKKNNIVYEEHLTTDENFTEKLNSYRAIYKTTEGVSVSYGYYPFIFVEEKAYSGFNSEVESAIKNLLKE